LFLATIDRHAQLNLAAFSERFEHESDNLVLDAEALAAAWRQILARDPDWFALDLEARLYALRHPAFRERYAANHREVTEAVARFMEDLATATGLTLKLPAQRLARILEVASEGFLAWAYLDPDDGELFKAFFELMIDAIVSDGS
ncbi:MAG: hypothetical protein ACYDB3_06275, partial [Acidimicrobiales bacterium]